MNQLTQQIAYLTARYGITSAEAYEVLRRAKDDIEIAKLICNIAKDDRKTPTQFLALLE